MEKGKKIFTRRDFIRAGSCAAMGGLMGLPLAGHATDRRPEKSRVVLIRDERALDPGKPPGQEVMLQMLDRALVILIKKCKPVQAWKALFRPDEIVGIKSNVWSHLHTPEPLEKAIVKRLVEIGVKRENIGVDDRGVLRNPLFMRSTALINVRPMRTHDWSGLGTLIKNYIMFASRPSQYHGNACEGLGALWGLPPVAGKTRLNILVMMTPLFHSVGPHHFSRDYTWPYGGLILSRDPVAADATGARIIQAKRNAFFGGERPISPPPIHIAAADTRFGLGNSHPDNIDLIKLGWKEGSLI
jgi:hypothetical protein